MPFIKSKKKWNESDNDWEICDDHMFRGRNLLEIILWIWNLLPQTDKGKVIDPPPSPINSNSNQVVRN